MKSVLLVVLAILFPPTLTLRQSTTDLASSVARMARIGRAMSPTFSPDGRRLAFVADLSGVPQVWVIPAEGGWPQQVTAGDDPVGGVRWSPNGDWLALTIAPGGGLNTQVYVVRPDGTGLRRLTPGGKDNNNLIDWTRDGQKLIVASNRRNLAAIEPYLVDPSSGASELVVEGQGIVQLSEVTRDGRHGLLVESRNRGDNDLYLIELASRRRTLLTPHDPPCQFSGELLDDGRTVYLASNKDRDLSAFGRIRLDEQGKPGPIEVVAQRRDAELAGFQLDDQATVAALSWNVGGKSELDFVALPSGELTRGPTLPAELIGGLVFSRSGERLAAVVSGAINPPDIWVLEIKQGRWRQVTMSPHPGVNLSDLVRPELVTFPAHDGLELSGWLYRPQSESGPQPYVVSFHGGPEGQERPSFNTQYQALVASGIGVFAPNVRGSSGFGKRFVNLDNGALRVDGVKDIESCVRYLVDRRIADPKRIGITGGSYGGYMTMAGMTEFPDLFAAGVNLFGIVNFATFFAHTEPWMAAISTVEYGDPSTQADLLKSLSPIHKLDRIKAALMVQHGANDTNVPLIEAEQIVDHLKQRSVPVEYVLFPDEGHGWRKVQNRIRSTVELVRFFDQHLKGARSE